MGIASNRSVKRRVIGRLRRPSLHFIVGVPRSGTSLCRMLLGSHRRICAPSETPWMFGAYGDDVSLGALLRVLCNSTYGPVQSISGVSTGDIRAAARNFVLSIFRSKMRGEGKDVLLLKTPDDIGFIDEILDLFKSSLVVHVRRDVRDVALSTQKTGWEQLNGFGANTFENSVRRWIALEQAIETAKTRAPEQIVSVCYEDLVRTPASALRRVMDRLQLSFEPEMLSYWKHAHGVPEWDIGSLNAAAFARIESTRAFAYRMHVPSDEEKRTIERHATDIVALGYAPGWGG